VVELGVAEDETRCDAGDERVAFRDQAVDDIPKSRVVAVVTCAPELFLDDRGLAGVVGLQGAVAVEIAREIVDDAAGGVGQDAARSEDRRVGKECGGRLRGGVEEMGVAWVEGGWNAGDEWGAGCNPASE